MGTSQKATGAPHIELTFVVQGEEAPDDKVNLKAPLKAPVVRALESTGNEGRDLGEWTVKKKDGTVLALDEKVEDLPLANKDRVFLSLDVGAGGEIAGSS